MLSELGLYSDSFETPFINQSRQFYADEGKEQMRDLEVCAFVQPPALYAYNCSNISNTVLSRVGRHLVSLRYLRI